MGSTKVEELLVMKVGNDVLFQEPTVSTRRLRRSVVVATDDDLVSVRFVGEPFEFVVDQEVLMFFNGKREFMQQIGRIAEIQLPPAEIAPTEAEGAAAPAPAAAVGSAATPAAASAKVAKPMAKVPAKSAKPAKAAPAPVPEKPKESPIFVIEPVGDPISAESRQNYRVSTISAGIQARMGKEADLSVQDLSATGFAVIASQQYKIGQTLDVFIRLGEESCHGKVSIQSFRELDKGRLRYGLRAIEEDPHARAFLSTLQRISFAVQREQLQRSGGVR